VIIRIMAEGQYDVPDSASDGLNGLDARVEQAVDARDADVFSAALGELLAAVRAQGTVVADDALVDSDLVLPPADATVDEVAAMLGDEGLIPG
jgi:hypothetical protein